MTFGKPPAVEKKSKAKKNKSKKRGLKGKGGIKARGSRAQVWHGSAQRTSGGLSRDDLTFNSKTGRIVSKRKQAAGRKLYETVLVPKGYAAKKGEFKLFKKQTASE